MLRQKKPLNKVYELLVPFNVWFFLKILLQVKHKEEKKDTRNKLEENKLHGVNK